MANEYFIGDFLKRIKRPLELEDNQDYNLVTIRMNHNGVVLRGKKKGAEIKSKMYEVKEGDFILSGIDARNGAFGIVPQELDGAIVTNDFWYFEIDEKIISKTLFLELTATTWFEEICKRGSDGTTQRIRLQKDKFFNQRIFLPNGTEQDELLDRILGFKNGHSDLVDEIEMQNQLLSQLKQSILQEAIQGKLTADWREQNPNTESASELLKRIKAEKNQFIKDKKIKREKALPPILEEEIPFELPEGWVWCRLGELYEIVRGSSPRPKGDPRYWTKNRTQYHWITIADFRPYIENGYLQNTREFLTEEGSKKSRAVGKSDIIIACSGVGSVGKSAKLSIEGYIYDGLLGIRNISNETIKNYLSLFIKYKELEIYSVATGANWLNINIDLLRSYVLPLPSEKEQKAIVEKVESLMQKCQALEQEIKTSEANAKMLMQAVLKEAFEGKKEVVGV